MTTGSHVYFQSYTSSFIAAGLPLRALKEDEDKSEEDDNDEEEDMDDDKFVVSDSEVIEQSADVEVN